MKKSISFLAVAFILLLPFASYSCALCQGGAGSSEKVQMAYKATTLFLLLLPIVMCSSIYFFLKRNAFGQQDQ